MPIVLDGTTGITAPAIDVATPVTAADGGTGLTSFTSGGAMYATSTSALTTGTLPVASGGTGQTTYTDGQLLIGNTTGNTLTKATLTAGAGTVITSGSGSITIAPDSGYNGFGARTVSTGSPTGGNDGDIWYKY